MQVPSLASEFFRAEYTPEIYSKQMWKGFIAVQHWMSAYNDMFYNVYNLHGHK